MRSLPKLDRPAQTQPDQQPATLREVCDAIERLDEKLDEFFRVLLNAKFPYGKPTDRWARR
jgi:hypothetical protein